MKWYQHKHFESNQGQRSTTADHFKPPDSAISPSLKQPFQSTFNAVSIDPLQIYAGHFKACFLKVLLSGTAHINTAFWNRQVYLCFCRGFLMLLWNSLSIVDSGMPCLISSKVQPKMGRLWSWMKKWRTAENGLPWVFVIWFGIFCLLNSNDVKTFHPIISHWIFHLLREDLIFHSFLMVWYTIIHF